MARSPALLRSRRAGDAAHPRRLRASQKKRQTRRRRHTAADFDLIALDLALDRLAAIYPKQSQIVELRFFAGLTLEETAEALSISSATVSREWTLARAWLRRAMSTA
jgi:RNA polymerase sigma factor (sigma-70 family)